MPNFSKLYTRTGDDGFTGLIGRERVPKYDLHPEASARWMSCRRCSGCAARRRWTHACARS